MFEELVAGTSGTSGAGAVAAWARVENASCARRLAAMVSMLEAAYAASGSAERELWCLDNYGAVAAHIGAVQRITRNAAESQLLIATGLHELFPKVAEVFAEGLITLQLVKAIVTRCALVTDPDARRKLDAALAAGLVSWGPMSVDGAAHAIDALVQKLDPLAVHRAQTRARGRSVDVVIEDGSGMAQLFCTLFATDAAAFDERVEVLAATVCPADPRTKDQRRADAVGALSRGCDRLACLCETEGCPAAQKPPSSGVVVYVVAHEDTVSGPVREPAAPQDLPVPDDTSTPADAPTPAAEDATGGDDATADPAIDECAGLDGVPPKMFTKPIAELTLTEALTPAPGAPSGLRPGVLMGGQFLPGAITRRAALNATFVKILHPGQAPPEPRYRPSKKLTDFVRCRDLMCRFPGCTKPATETDIDHTIPWPYGPTQASNLKCLCRTHHLLKTFWVGAVGWRDRQLPDGTVIWTDPDGHTHTTTPGSRLLFGELCAPTAPAKARAVPVSHTPGLKMPRRTTTRAQDRARRIIRDRELNRADAEAESEAERAAPDPPPPF